MARNRGQITRKGPGKFQLRVGLGEDDNGKRMTRSKTFHGTKAAALKELTAMLSVADEETHLTPNKTTVAEFWTDFIESKMSISDRTRGFYEERYDKDILPYLGKYRLKDVTPKLLQKWVLWMHNKRGLSPRTIRHSKSLLFQMLSLAVRWHLILMNPADGVEVPKKEASKAAALTPEEFNAVLDVAEERKDPMLPLWSLLLNSGLRSQEALVLTWADLDGTTISVNKGLTKDAAGQYVVGPTKNEKSRRTVSLPEVCAQLLKEYQRSTGGIAGALMFSTASGGFIDPSNARRWWKRACKRAGVPIVRLHDTRHTHATALLIGGVPLKVVSERLGHSNISTTADIYQHVMPEMDSAAADVMDELSRRKA